MNLPPAASRGRPETRPCSFPLRPSSTLRATPAACAVPAANEFQESLDGPARLAPQLGPNRPDLSNDGILRATWLWFHTPSSDISDSGVVITGTGSRSRAFSTAIC